MDCQDFFDQLEAHPDLEGVGIEEAGNGEPVAVVVRHRPSDSKFRVLISSVMEHPWETLESIFDGRREPQVLSHMTRVVGYFSRVENWNRSKVGELAGRHRGDYSVKSSAESK